MRKPRLKAGSRPPWVGLAAAVWIQLSAGNAYNFPLYSTALKSVLGFSQQQLTILGVANDIGENVGLLPGIACNRFPPWAVLSVGTLACFIGYGVLWLALSQTLQNLPYWLLWVSLCVATNSNTWFGTAVLVTNMRNFPLSRGTVAGILKGYIGISAAIYTVIYGVVLNESASALLLFLALGLPFLCLTLMFLIRPCTPSGEDSSVHVHFLFTQGASVFLAIYIVIIVVLYDTISLSTAVSCTLVSIMVILMMSPLAIPIKMTIFPASIKTPLPSVGSLENLVTGDGDLKQEHLLTPSSSATNLEGLSENEYASDIDMLIAVGEGAVKNKRRPRRGEDFNLREALIKADFWLLWVVYFLGVGSGVTVLNNLAQIGTAQGDSDTTMLLCIFSFSNFVGRLGSGAVSEHFVRSNTIPRTIWMTFAQVVMIIAFLMYVYSSLSGTLYVATALIGVCYGIQYSTMVPTVSELFGLIHFGIIYNFMQLGNPTGALLLSGLLAGYIYDAEAAKQGESTCLGSSCFRLTFLVLAGVCGLGIILSIILTIRIRPVYQMLYAGGSFRLPLG